MFPSPERATFHPSQPLSVTTAPISFGPCCNQTPFDRVKAHTAPTRVISLSNGPPTSAVLPSDETATLAPNAAWPLCPAPTSFEPYCVQTPPDRANTQTAPTPSASFGPPIAAVSPSVDSATSVPNRAWAAPAPVSFGPCCQPRRAEADEHPRRTRAVGVVGGADQGGVAVGRERHAHPTPDRPSVSLALSPPPCCDHVAPERV